MSIQKPQTTTLIETLSDGYRAVNRRPWLLLVPILLNIYLWFGTPLSFGPLVTDLNAALRTVQQSPGFPLGDEFRQQSEQQIESLQHVDMRQPLAVLNYVPLTIYVIGSFGTIGGGFGIPVVQALPQLVSEQRQAIEISSYGGAIVAFLLINMVVLMLSTVFLTETAQAVRADHIPFATWLRRLWSATLAILGYAALIVGLALLVGLPVVFLISLLLLISPPLGALLLLVLMILWFWAAIYLGFTPEAIVVSGVGPLRALHASFNIVRQNFWSTLMFLLLLFVIAVGSGVIWQALSTNAVGSIIAIVCSAYIYCGIVAARMAFYRDRLRRWQIMAAAAQTGWKARG